MKLEKLSAIAELVSSVAIVATLIYLSVQTQQTNAALFANSRQATLMAELSILSDVINNPEVPANSARPFQELTTAEQLQLRNAFAGVLRSREFAWLQYQTGILDEATLDSYMETLVRFIQQSDGLRVTWESFSPRTNPEFTDYVNTILTQSE